MLAEVAEWGGPGERIRSSILVIVFFSRTMNRDPGQKNSASIESLKCADYNKQEMLPIGDNFRMNLDRRSMIV